VRASPRRRCEGLTDEVAAPAAVSEELAALGPFFAVDSHAAGVSLPPWQPMVELVDGSSVLAERVQAVRAFLAAGTGQETAAVDLRVAASVVHLGLVARVVSPLLALAVLHQRCGRVRAADLWWQPTLGSLFPLSVREPALDSGVGFGDGVLGGVVAEFSAAATGFGVNEHILRGNAASALAGAARTLTAARPDLRADIHTLMTDLLAGTHLADAGRFEPDAGFRRRSCCLIYRAAPDHKGALCGDCVLASPHGPMDT
jgi:hypothetical protein